MLTSKTAMLTTLLATICSGCPEGEDPKVPSEGACTLTCEGEVYACETTDQVGCSAGAFADVPRCLYQLSWSAGAVCEAP